MNSALQLSAFSADQPVCVIVSNRQYLPLTENWLAGFMRFGTKNLYIAAVDRYTFATLSARGFCTELWEVRGLRQIFAVKIRAVAKLLHAGFDVLLSDVDAIWLKDCATLLSHPDYRAYDALFSQSMSYPAAALERWGLALCSGFFLLRTNRRTLAFVDQWLQLLVDERRTEQDALNCLLLRQHLQWQFEDVHLFSDLYRPPEVAPHLRGNAQRSFYTRRMRAAWERFRSTPLREIQAARTARALLRLLRPPSGEGPAREGRFYSSKVISGSYSSEHGAMSIGILPFRSYRRGCTDPADDPAMTHIGAGTDIARKIAAIKLNRPLAWYLDDALLDSHRRGLK
ncbi:MAG: hypothetical protein KDD69_12720 [Bdellovibrionales bacterium]|nr:hypothetical protein [Bdellovibrionales bacterium]